MKKRICFVIPSLGIGGTERQLLYLLKGLAPHFEIMVVCTRSEGAWSADVQRIGRVKVLKLRGGWDPRLKSRLRKLFRKYNPTIVHSYMFGFDHAVNVAARAEGIPVVIASRRQLAGWKKPRHIRLQKKGNALVDAIVANSRVVAEFAAKQEGESLERYTVILNGIDVDCFQSNIDPTQIRRRYQIPDGKKIVGIVANFSPVKDHVLFVEMARLLLQRRDDVHFVLAGKGPLMRDIGRRMERYSMQDAVTGLTTISELQDVYRMLDVCVLTSKSEGFPNVVMESLASGTATVAANVGGIPELIEDGVTGTLVGSRNPEDFARAVEHYLDHPDDATAVGLRGQAFVREHLSLQAMVDAHLALYNDLLRAKRVD